MRWFVDGSNVMGARPDGWWNDRAAATRRLTQQIAEWCRTHDDEVTVVFDRPVDAATLMLAGGNLTVEEAPRSGRDAADDRIVDLAAAHDANDGTVADAQPDAPTEPEPARVVTSDRGLIARLPAHVTTMGAVRFLGLVDPNAVDRRAVGRDDVDRDDGR